MAREEKPADSMSPNIRWKSFATELRLQPGEQTRRSLRDLVEAGKRQEAVENLALLRLEELQAARSSESELQSRRSARYIEAGATSSERQIAEFITSLEAERLSAHPEVAHTRELLLGRPEPVTPERAWAILDAPRSSLAGDHRDGPLAHLTFPHASRNPKIVARLRAQRVAPGTVPVRRGGVLWNEAQSLCRLEISDAAWFLITGELPRVPAISALVDRLPGESPFTPRIELAFMPHVSLPTIARVAKGAIREHFQRPRGPLAPALFAVAEFVRLESTRTGIRPAWRGLHERWNRIAPPAWRFKTPEHMRRAYDHARDIETRKSNSPRRRRNYGRGVN